MKTIETLYAEAFDEYEKIFAANPYGCNQYGEGWKMPHNGRQSLRGEESLDELRRKQQEYQRDIKNGKKKRPSFDSDETKEYSRKNKERIVKKKRIQTEIENLERELAEKNVDAA